MTAFGAKYFDIYPKYNPKIPQEHFNFIVGLLLPFDEDNGSLRLTLMSVTPEVENKCACVLNLDYFSNKEMEFQRDNILNWLNKAHEHIESSFEACIKNPLREKFKETI